MLNKFQNIIYSFKKPKIIFILSKEKNSFSETVFSVLKKYFEVKNIKNKIKISDLLNNRILILEPKIEELKNFGSLLKNIEAPILIINDIEEADSGSEKIIQDFSSSSFLLFNSDNEKIRNLKEKIQSQNLSFGFEEGADFRATDVKTNGGTNFKINYKGNTVPFWLEKAGGREKIYPALAAAGVGEILKLNLLKVSEALKKNQ